MAEAKIFKVIIQVADDGSVYECHGINHAGAFWLVPAWLEVPSQGITKPERIIRLDGLRMQPGGTLGRDADFVLNVPVTKAALDGPIQSQIIDNFHVEGLPDIAFPIKSVPRI
jgi:hypothetical protein